MQRGIAGLLSALTALALVLWTCQTLGDQAKASSPSADAPDLWSAAMAAYAKHDYVEYRSRLEELVLQRPTHPTILYRLAGAQALNGGAAAAAATLRRLVRLGVYRDVAADPDFAPIVNTTAMQSAIHELAGVRAQRIGAATEAFRIPDPAFIPEGIAYERATGSFFVSSQYERKIARIDAKGAVSDFVSEGQDGIWMVFGIGVDASRPWLWAVSTAEPIMRGFTKADEKRAGLFAFDLGSGRLMKRVVVEPSEPAHYFDDLTIAPDGRVFLSDGGTGTVYTLAPDADRLTVLVAPGVIQGPNGLALAPDGKQLFVSDYAGFIVSVDVASGVASRLEAPSDATLYGIDGLAWYGEGLIGVQNGVEPARVVRLRLSSDRRSVTGVDILAMNHPRMHEPTLGVVAGDDFYFVADSQGTLLRKTVQVERAQFTPPAILKLSLRPPA